MNFDKNIFRFSPRNFKLRLLFADWLAVIRTKFNTLVSRWWKIFVFNKKHRYWRLNFFSRPRTSSWWNTSFNAGDSNPSISLWTHVNEWTAEFINIAEAAASPASTYETNLAKNFQYARKDLQIHIGTIVIILTSLHSFPTQ